MFKRFQQQGVFGDFVKGKFFQPHDKYPYKQCPLFDILYLLAYLLYLAFLVDNYLRDLDILNLRADVLVSRFIS